jgi:4-hydroxy-2-oxoheptanedioate aldolase
MRANHVRQRLAAGEPSLGTWLSIPSPESAEFLGGLPFDWLTVDAEHNPVDIQTLARMFSAIGSKGIAPMVRIPWNTPEHFKRVLDAGAWGIVVPMVNTREEAERAVEATRYYPLGNRSVGGGRHALSFNTGGKTYYENANDNILLSGARNARRAKGALLPHTSRTRLDDHQHDPCRYQRGIARISPELRPLVRRAE